MDFSGNKKTILGIVLGLLFLLVAGGAAGFFGMAYIQAGRDQQEAIEKAVAEDINGFCEALQANDIGTARLYCSERVAAQMALDMMDAKEYRKTVLEGLNLTEEDLTENLKSSLDMMTDTLGHSVVTGVEFDITQLEILEKSRESVTAKLPVTITGCGSMVNLDFSGEIALANVALANYTSENQKTLMDLYDDGGEEAVKKNLFEQEMGSLFSAMNAKAQTASADSHQWEMTFVIGKDGKGNITAATIDSVSTP